jgi:hypothetical protein
MVSKVVMLLVLAAGFLAVDGGQALASHVTCGETITTDTTLDSDLVDCPDDGIVIGADDITLDLRGHTIDGDGCPEGDDCRTVAINNVAGHDRLTIEGGSIREFAVGVLVIEARGTRVRRLVSSHHHFVGIAVFASRSSRIERSSFFGSGNQGIFVGASADTRSDDTRIAANYVADQPFGGIVAEGSDRTLITGNRVVHNGEAIIVSGDENRVVHNMVDDAFECEEGCGLGIAVEAGSGNLVAANHVARAAHEGIGVNNFDPEVPMTGTVIRGNVVSKAGIDGIAIATVADAPGSVTDTLVAGNIAIGAADDGIDVGSAATTLTGNLAVRNGDLGIEAVAGVTDGGRNKARGNGNPAQCTNIACN